MRVLQKTRIFPLDGWLIMQAANWTTAQKDYNDITATRHPASKSRQGVLSFTILALIGDHRFVPYKNVGNKKNNPQRHSVTQKEFGKISSQENAERDKCDLENTKIQNRILLGCTHGRFNKVSHRDCLPSKYGCLSSYYSTFKELGHLQQ